MSRRVLLLLCLVAFSSNAEASRIRGHSSTGRGGTRASASSEDPGDVTAPEVVNVTSAIANGIKAAGVNIDITVEFDEDVEVTGNPRLELETGATDRFATYQSGDGTNTLTFRYTVQSADLAADLDYKATTSLGLNGGDIEDAAANDADLDLAEPGAAGSLGNNKAIVVEGYNVFTAINGTSVTWDHCYLGENLVTDTWTDSSGSDDLTASETNADVDVSTTGLTSLGGIGIIRENKAVNPADGAGTADDYRKTTTVVWGDGSGDWHVRMLFLPNVDMTTSQFPMRHLTSATEFFRMFGSSATSITFNARADADGASYSRAISTLPGTGVWHFIDVSYCHDCGTGGFSQFTIFVNGTDKTPTVHTAAVNPEGTGQLSIMGSGAASAIDANFVGLCVRYGARLTTEADHDADLVRLGL